MVRRQQRTYFSNIQDLPVESLGYQIVPNTLVVGPTQGSYWAEIRTTTELQGYDAKPIASYDRWLFRPSTDGQRYVLVSTTDKGWENSHDTATQPWEVEHVYVDEYGSVLGIFDSRTAAQADRLMRILSEGKDDDSLTIPESEQPSTGWGTLVYVLGDQTIINGLRADTVGDPGRADGLTIALPADVNDPSKGTASYRVSINPRALAQPASVLGRLVRHEMTHATLGARGQGAPLWLTEGIAEWVSVRPMARSERRLPASAMTVGLHATSLPTSADFAGSDAEGWYAVSWWVCEYVANTYGAHTLWTLLDRLAGGANQDQVLQQLLQITPDVLVRRGVALMSATYAS
ncbi:hypothetical protein GCM10028801_22950 [Nocardioides maradonensis]